LATYRANGFEVIGTARRHAKIDGRYVDEILIEKSLRDWRDQGPPEPTLRMAKTAAGLGGPRR
jgi:hypothetical protein